MHRLLSCLLILIFALVSQGCFVNPEASSREMRLVDVDNAWMGGDLGTVRGLDHSADIYEWGWSGYHEVTLNVDTDAGAAMAVLDFEGDLGALLTKEGPQTFTPVDEFFEDLFDTDAPMVGVLGCSGQSRGSWDYDKHAGEVTIESEPHGKDCYRLRVNVQLPPEDLTPATNLRTELLIFVEEN